MNLWKRAGCQTESKALKKSMVARIFREPGLVGFAKPIQNGQRKIKNLINGRPSRAEIGLMGKENGITFRKEE